MLPGPDIRIDMSELNRLAENLRRAPPRIRSAVIGTVNRTGRIGMTAVRKTLTKETGVPAADLAGRSRGLSEKKARTGDISYEVIVRGRYTPLSYFAPIQRQKGVSARPWGKRRIFRGTFIARAGGHEGVFKRVGKARFPIKELWGPSLPVELIRGGSRQAFMDAWQPRIGPNLTREISRVLAELTSTTR